MLYTRTDETVQRDTRRETGEKLNCKWAQLATRNDFPVYIILACVTVNNHKLLTHLLCYANNRRSVINNCRKYVTCNNRHKTLRHVHDLIKELFCSKTSKFTTLEGLWKIDFGGYLLWCKNIINETREKGTITNNFIEI